MMAGRIVLRVWTELLLLKVILMPCWPRSLPCAAVTFMPTIIMLLSLVVIVSNQAVIASLVSDCWSVCRPAPSQRFLVHLCFA